MTRPELKEIIARIIKKLQKEGKEDGPKPACLFGDADPCDVTTKYGIGEEG